PAIVNAKTMLKWKTGGASQEAPPVIRTRWPPRGLQATRIRQAQDFSRRDSSPPRGLQATRIRQAQDFSRRDSSPPRGLQAARIRQAHNSPQGAIVCPGSSHHSGLVEVGYGGGLVGVAAAGALIHPFAQFLARLEVRDQLGRHVHFFTGLRVAPHARLAPRQGKAAEAADFDALALGQRIGHRVQDRLDCKVHVASRQLRVAARQHGDEFGLGQARHHSSRCWSSLAFSRAPRLVVPEEALASVMRWMVSAVSALSRALIDSWIERALRSMLMIMASTWSPACRTVVASSTRPAEISEARR